MINIKFNFKYLISFLFIFAAEVFIALYVHDKIIRPYIGDVLVVILMYTFIRIFTEKLRFLPIYLLIFASLVEIAQYFNIVSILGLANNKAASIIIGSSFDFADIGCYLCGSILLIIFEKAKHVISR